MGKKKYVEIDGELLILFEQRFGDLAEIYRKIYCDKRQKDITYETLSEIYNYSVTHINKIVKDVEEFIENPWGKMTPPKFDIEELDGILRMPMAFTPALRWLSADAHKLFAEMIYLYQHQYQPIVPRSHVLFLSTQYTNKPRRTLLLNELRQMKIELSDGQSADIFDEIVDLKGAVRFQFSAVALFLLGRISEGLVDD